MRYRPGFWEMIKYGWVQYLAIFFVVKYLLSLLEVRRRTHTHMRGKHCMLLQPRLLGLALSEGARVDCPQSPV